MIMAIVILIVFVGGYSLGRRYGREEGEKIGLARAALDLRRTTLEQGQCPICHYSIHQQDFTSNTV
jgi:hypothetical protein